MKKLVEVGFIQNEAGLNRGVLLNAFSRVKQVYKQEELNVQAKIFFSGVEAVPLARKIKHVMEIKLEFIEIEGSIYYRVPNQITPIEFNQFPVRLLSKIELSVVSKTKKVAPLNEADKKLRRYKELLNIRRADFCSTHQIKEFLDADMNVKKLDIKNLLPEEQYELFVEKLEKEEEFIMTYKYVEINANYELNKWSIELDVFDSDSDLEQVYLMINEEVAICKEVV